MYNIIDKIRMPLSNVLLAGLDKHRSEVTTTDKTIQSTVTVNTPDKITVNLARPALHSTGYFFPLQNLYKKINSTKIQ